MAQAQSSSAKKNKPDVGVNAAGDAEGTPTTFHDFLGNKGQESAPPAGGPQPEVSPSATSDLGSERVGGNHFEGIAIYGSRGESSNRFGSNKRSNSDSLMMSSRDKYPQGQADSQDSLLLMKLLRYSGGEHPRRPHDEEASYGRHQMRPISGSFLPQSSTGGRTDANSSKWDRATTVNPGPVLQYPPRTGQVMPFGYQSASNRFKDTNVAPPLVSQTAADEGSRTGIKGSGVLSSINAMGTISGRQPAGVLIRSSGKQKSGIAISEPESSTAPSHRGTDSGGHQMTIFYGGQAHVFDNVHPNKADIIMALAGSSGGSWSTTYKPNSGARPTSASENCRSGDADAGISILKELQDAKSLDKVDSQRGFGSGSRE